MKKLIFIFLLAPLLSQGQIQVYKPYRTNGNVMVADSALFIGKLKIPSYTSPSLGEYSDSWGQSFGVNTTNSRLTVRGSSVWLEYPTLTEVNSLIGSAGSVTPSSTTTFSNKTISGISNTITDIPYSALTIANLNVNATLRWTSGTEYNGSAARQIGINLSNPNTWTAIQTFSVSPVVPTSTVGTSNTQAASNAFVMTAVMGVNTISATSTLTLTTRGFYKFTGTTSTWTLNPVASNTGVRYTIVNRGVGTITLNTTGAANDIDESGVFVNTKTIAPNTKLELYCDGVKWVIL